MSSFGGSARKALSCAVLEAKRIRGKRLFATSAKSRRKLSCHAAEPIGAQNASAASNAGAASSARVAISPPAPHPMMPTEPTLCDSRKSATVSIRSLGAKRIDSRPAERYEVVATAAGLGRLGV